MDYRLSDFQTSRESRKENERIEVRDVLILIQNHRH